MSPRTSIYYSNALNAFHFSTLQKTNRPSNAPSNNLAVSESSSEKKKSAASTKKVMKKLEDKKQQSTLGDLDSLADLKKDLDKEK